MTDPNGGAAPTQPALIASPSLVPFHWANELPVLSINWLVSDFFPAKSLNLMIGASQAGKPASASAFS